MHQITTAHLELMMEGREEGRKCVLAVASCVYVVLQGHTRNDKCGSGRQKGIYETKLLGETQR